MPIYTYETIPTAPGVPARRFDVRQSMSDPPLTRDPQTGEPVRKVFAAGFAVLSRGAAGPRAGSAEAMGRGCGRAGGCACALE